MIGCVQHDCAECQAKQSSLDAMTAQRDALKRKLQEPLIYSAWQKMERERDSAREALAKAVELLRVHEWGYGDQFDRVCNSCGRYKRDWHNEVCSIAAFLAAQPETKR